MLNKILIISFISLAGCESKSNDINQKEARGFTGTYSVALTPLEGLALCPAGAGVFSAAQEDSFSDYLDIDGRVNFEGGLSTTINGSIVLGGVINEGRLTNYNLKVKIEMFGNLINGGWYESSDCSGTFNVKKW